MTYQEALMRLILEPSVQNTLVKEGKITLEYTPEEFLFEENQVEPGFVEAFDKEGKKITDEMFI